MDAIVAAGATITHHHAVGTDHQPWLAAGDRPGRACGCCARSRPRSTPRGSSTPACSSPDPPLVRRRDVRRRVRTTRWRSRRGCRQAKDQTRSWVGSLPYAATGLVGERERRRRRRAARRGSTASERPGRDEDVRRGSSGSATVSPARQAGDEQPGARSSRSAGRRRRPPSPARTPVGGASPRTYDGSAAGVGRREPGLDEPAGPDRRRRPRCARCRCRPRAPGARPASTTCRRAGRVGVHERPLEHPGHDLELGVRVLGVAAPRRRRVEQVVVVARPAVRSRGWPGRSAARRRRSGRSGARSRVDEPVRTGVQDHCSCRYLRGCDPRAPHDFPCSRRASASAPARRATRSRAR